MPSAQTLLAFLVTTAIFAFIPGPAMLYTAARTLAGGRWAGLMASLGIHLGGSVHVVATAAGLSLLLKAVPTLYLAIKLVGAVYLMWLGLSLFRSRTAADPAFSAPQPDAGRRAFLQSVSVEVLNPKTALFFLALLPQFTDPAGSTAVWVQFLALGTIVNLMFSSADLVCVLLANAVATRLRRSGRAQRVLQRTGGAVLIGLGARLAAEHG